MVKKKHKSLSSYFLYFSLSGAISAPQIKKNDILHMQAQSVGRFSRYASKAKPPSMMPMNITNLNVKEYFMVYNFQLIIVIIWLRLRSKHGGTHRSCEGRGLSAEGPPPCLTYTRPKFRSPSLNVFHSGRITGKCFLISVIINIFACIIKSYVVR